MKEKTKNACDGQTKILVCKTYVYAKYKKIKKNPPEAAKVATSVKFFKVGKT